MPDAKRSSVMPGLIALVCVTAPCLAQAKDAGQSLIHEEGLTGWHSEPAETKDHWQNNSGVIIGENPDKKGSILWTDKKYTDFELTMTYKTPSDDYDSGIFLRGKTHQVQIGISRSRERDLTGSIYAPKDGRGGYPAISDKVKKVHRPGEWNKLRIIVRDQRIQTFLNGQKFVDYKAGVIPKQGPIGLQLHPNVHIKMMFRNIRLRELDEPSAASAPAE